MGVEIFVAGFTIAVTVIAATWRLSNILNGIEKRLECRMNVVEKNITDKMDKNYIELKTGIDDIYKRVYQIEAILWAQGCHPDHKGHGLQRRANEDIH